MELLLNNGYRIVMKSKMPIYRFVLQQMWSPRRLLLVRHSVSIRKVALHIVEVNVCDVRHHESAMKTVEVN